MLEDGSLDHLAFSICVNLELDVTALEPGCWSRGI